MGLYRRRIVRYILGILAFIAVVQILTTLHFSTINDGERSTSRKATRRTDEPPTIIQDSSVKATAIFDLRKSKVFVSANGSMLHRLNLIFY
jgi:hypothetical protein